VGEELLLQVFALADVPENPDAVEGHTVLVLDHRRGAAHGNELPTGCFELDLRLVKLGVLCFKATSDVSKVLAWLTPNKQVHPGSGHLFERPVEEMTNGIICFYDPLLEVRVKGSAVFYPSYSGKHLLWSGRDTHGPS
jgi:hypothetical protein